MTTNEKITELKRCLWRFSNFEKRFLVMAERKKKGLSSDQSRLLDELYSRYQGQKDWKAKVNGSGPS